MTKGTSEQVGAYLRDVHSIEQQALAHCAQHPTTPAKNLWPRRSANTALKPRATNGLCATGSISWGIPLANQRSLGGCGRKGLRTVREVVRRPSRAGCACVVWDNPVTGTY
jgi:hypothetical protein